VRLFLEIDAFDAGGDAGEDFVGDGVEPLGQPGDGKVGAEDLDAVALDAVGDVSDVDHGDVHADIADIGGRLAVYETVATTVAEVAVEAVGIADGDGGDARRTVEDAPPAVAHRLGRCDIVNLKDGSAKGTDRH